MQLEQLCDMSDKDKQICVTCIGGFGLLALIIHEDNDRCHYYHGEWNKGDLTRGCIAIAVGVALRYILTRVLIN